MSVDRLRTFSALEYGDPRGYLIKLREMEPRVAKSGLARKVRTLRTHDLKQWRELREAALFCHFMSERIGTEVRIAKGEAQDYDAVATWQEQDVRKFAPIQIKEVVPSYLNSNANLESVIASLSKYVDSSDLTVAVHLNKQVRFIPASITIPQLPVRSLWVFGSISPDASRWNLWGDLLNQPAVTEHAYPAA